MTPWGARTSFRPADFQCNLSEIFFRVERSELRNFKSNSNYTKFMGGKGNGRASQGVNSAFYHCAHFEALFEPGFTLKIIYLLVFLPAKTSTDPGEEKRRGFGDAAPNKRGLGGRAPHLIPHILVKNGLFSL